MLISKQNYAKELFSIKEQTQALLEKHEKQQEQTHRLMGFLRQVHQELKALKKDFHETKAIHGSLHEKPPTKEEVSTRLDQTDKAISSLTEEMQEIRSNLILVNDEIRQLLKEIRERTKEMSDNLEQDYLSKASFIEIQRNWSWGVLSAIGSIFVAGIIAFISWLISKL